MVLMNIKRVAIFLFMPLALMALRPIHGHAVSFFQDSLWQTGFSQPFGALDAGTHQGKNDGSSNDWMYLERKDPFFAAALSWFVPGLGQLYVHEPLKAVCFWTLDTSLLWGAVLTVATLDIGLERDIGFHFAVRMRENLSRTRVLVSVGLGVCWLVFHVYQVIAAADSAIEHYQNILLREMQRDGLALEILPGMGGVSWSHAF
jgi:TM2 domain-containing membrane protein YozV